MDCSPAAVIGIVGCRVADEHIVGDFGRTQGTSRDVNAAAITRGPIALETQSLAVQYGQLARPVALDAIRFIAGKSAIKINKSPERDSLVVGSGTHPDLASAAGSQVDGGSYRLFRGGP